jgi:hypothetical protein
MAVLGFLAVYVLNDIKGSIAEIKTTIKTLESDLRDGQMALERRHEALDHRLIIVEQRCNHEHGKY